jgi:hypothetical protein
MGVVAPPQQYFSPQNSRPQLAQFDIGTSIMQKKHSLRSPQDADLQMKKSFAQVMYNNRMRTMNLQKTYDQRERLNLERHKRAKIAQSRCLLQRCVQKKNLQLRYQGSNAQAQSKDLVTHVEKLPGLVPKITFEFAGPHVQKPKTAAKAVRTYQTRKLLEVRSPIFSSNV